MYRNLARLAAATAAAIAVVVTAGAPPLAADTDRVPLAVNDLPTVIVNMTTHIACRSMSGGIGLIAVVDHPDRVASLTFVCTSIGKDGLPPPSEELASPAAPDHGAVGEWHGLLYSADLCSGRPGQTCLSMPLTHVTTGGHP